MANPAKRTSRQARRIGRPPAGDRGERVKDYPQVSFRLIVESMECYLRELPRHEQARVARLVSTRRSRNS